MSARPRVGAAARVAAAVLLIVAAGMLAGCSQVAALAPVGGNHETEVRYAAIDVLTTSGVAVLTAPVCATAGGAVTCSGTTVSGETVTVVSPADDPVVLTVTVGEKQLYSGSIMDVLDAAARSTS